MFECESLFTGSLKYVHIKRTFKTTCKKVMHKIQSVHIGSIF